MHPRKTGNVIQGLSGTSGRTLLSRWLFVGLVLSIAVPASSGKSKSMFAERRLLPPTVEVYVDHNEASRNRILKASPTARDLPGVPSLSNDTAASENAKLSTNLDWLFGGKQQRGWHLYLPLIRRLIDTEAEVTGDDFAAAVSRWQRSMKLTSNGILDGDTWSRMVSAFQARRIKDRASPPPDQLVTAPPEDFYDPSRGEEFRRVERQAYAAYRRLVTAAVADPSLRLATRRGGELAPGEKRLKIISAYRSQEYQEQLRQKSPHSGRAGLARQSPHLTGRTLDLYVGGEPVETKDANRLLQTQTPLYRWLVKHADKFGFHPYFYEPWHWEYIPR